MSARPETPTTATAARPERRGVSRRSAIEEANVKVSTVELAERLAAEQGKQLRRAGPELFLSCLLPDHEDRTPSFTVNPDKDLWFCHGCLRGGDAVELARYAWGYEKHEVAMAAADLLREFGHEIPPRPASWYRRQERQKSIRDAIGRARFDHLRRRLFRALFAPSIARIEDPDEREAEAAILWDAAALLTRMMVQRLRGDGR